MMYVSGGFGKKINRKDVPNSGVATLAETVVQKLSLQNAPYQQVNLMWPSSLYHAESDTLLFMLYPQMRKCGDLTCHRYRLNQWMTLK